MSRKDQFNNLHYLKNPEERQKMNNNRPLITDAMGGALPRSIMPQSPIERIDPNFKPAQFMFQTFVNMLPLVAANNKDLSPAEVVRRARGIAQGAVAELGYAIPFNPEEEKAPSEDLPE
jgi:hypothetical protein